MKIELPYVLTTNDWEVLSNLWNEPAHGVAPLQFGGSNGSHHGATATKLSRREPALVERKHRGGEWQGRKIWAERGSCLYRLTPLGVALVEHEHPTWAARRKADAVSPAAVLQVATQ